MAFWNRQEEEEAARLAAEAERKAQEEAERARIAAEEQAAAAARAAEEAAKQQQGEAQKQLEASQEAAKEATRHDIVKENPDIQNVSQNPTHVEYDTIEANGNKYTLTHQPYQKNVGYNDITVDFKSIKDDDQLFYFASTLYGDDEKARFLTDYAKYSKRDSGELIDAAELALGTKLFAQPYGNAAKNRAYTETLNSIPLYDLSGAQIDANSGNLNAILRAIQFNPNSSERSKALDAVDAMTKTPGSSFYGMKIDKSDYNKYLNNAALTQSDYNESVKNLQTLFYGTDEHRTDDEAEYLAEREAIMEAYADNPYVQGVYLRALDSVYTQITGTNKLPQPKQTEDGGEQLPQQSKQEAEADKPGFLKSVGNFFGIGGERETAEPTGITPYAAARNADGLEDAPIVTGEETDGQTQEGAPAQPYAATAGVSPTVDANYEPTEAQQAKAQRGRWLDDVIAANAAMTPAPQMPSPDAVQRPSGTLDLSDNPMEAAVVGVIEGRFEELTPESQKAAIEEMNSSPGMQALWGILSDKNKSRLYTTDADGSVLNWKGNENAYAVYRDNYAILGPTLSKYALMIGDDDYPKAVQTAAARVVASVVRDADERARTDTTGRYSDDLVNIYEQTLEDNSAYVQSLESVDQMILEEKDRIKDAERRAADQAEKDAALALEQAQNRILNGTGTAADWQLVMEKAPQVDATNLLATDEAYRSMAQEIALARTFSDGEDGGFFNDETSAYLKANNLPNDLTTAAAQGYKDVIAGYMNDALTEDARFALAMGFENLGAYYETSGLGDISLIEQRAKRAMQEDNEAIGEEGAALAMQSAYTGEGVNELAAAGASIDLAHSSNMAERLTMIDNLCEALDVENDAAQVRAIFDNDYGRYFGVKEYAKLMREMAEGGKFPSEELSNAIIAHLDSGANPYALGILPDEFGVIESMARKGGTTYKARQKAIEGWSQKNMTPEQGERFEVYTAVGENVGNMAFATVLNLATGNAALSTMAAYGPQSYNEGFSSVLQGGGNIKSANLMGSAYALATTISNMGTSVKFSDGVARVLGINTAVSAGANALGVGKAAKLYTGFLKALGETAGSAGAAAGSLVKGTIQNLADELIFDEIKEGLAKGALGDAAQYLITQTDGLERNPKVSEMVGAAMKAVAGIDAVGVVSDVADNMSLKNMIATLPLSIFSGVSNVVKDWPSIKALDRAAETGDPADAKMAAAMFARDMEDPDKAKVIDDGVKAIHKAEKTYENMVTDPVISEKVDQAAKAGEQADSHKQQADATKAAMDQCVSDMDESDANIASGDTSEQNIQNHLNASEAYAKNKTGYEEHTREQQQKEAERDALMEEAKNEAEAKANADIRAEKGRFIDSMRAEAKAADDQRQAGNVTAMEAGAFVDERYPQASDEQRDAIEKRYAQKRPVRPSEGFQTGIETLNRLSHRFGFKVIVQEGEQNAPEGWYDRKNNAITVRKDIAQSEAIRRVAIHEMTHFSEGTQAYKSFVKELLDFKYGGNEEQKQADIKSLVNQYNAFYAETGATVDGKPRQMDDTEAMAELAARASGEILSADPEFIDRLCAEKPSVGRRIWQGLKNFVAKMRGVNDPEMDRIRNVEKLFQKALDKAGTGEGNIQFSLVDVGEMGKGVYESNFPEGTPKDEKRARIVKLWRDVWSQKPIELNIVENGENRPIQASFDPDYDIENIRMTDLGKMLHSKNGSGGDRNVTLNLANDLYDIARTADYHSSEAEQGKKGRTHEGVKTWHYFFNDIIYRGENGDIPYTVWLDVKEKDNGGWVYQLYARKTKEKTLQTPSEEIGLGNWGGTSFSNNSVAQESSAVNENVKFSLPSDDILDAEIAAYNPTQEREYTDQTAPRGGSYGERQFASQTAQRSQAIPDWLKADLMGDPNQRFYERDTNDAQIARSWERMQQEGYEGMRDRLLDNDSGRITADDIADANMVMAMAVRYEDNATLLKMAMQYNTQGTEQAQAFQARRIFSRMTPVGIRRFVAGQTERKLEEHMRTHKNQKRRIDRAARRVEDEIQTKQGGDELQRLEAAKAFAVEGNKWGVPINEQQKALIDHYKLGSISRPGLFYNRATTKQRMLEAILATPNPLEVTGLGLNLVQRLEYLNAGEAVITNADLDYIGSQIAQYAYMPADEQEGRAGDLALARAYETFGNIDPATFREKARTWRYVSMLLSVPSAGRNVIGNAGQNAVNATAHGVGVELDRLVSLFTGERTMAHLSMADRAQGWHEFVDESVNTYRDFFVDKAITERGNNRHNLNRRGRVYQSNVLEGMRNMEGFLMSFGDRNFWKKAFANSMAEQQRVADLNGVELDFEAAKEQAIADANYATFSEDSAVRDAFAMLKRVPVVGDVLDFVMPFTGVPTNIVRRMWQFSPAGLASSAMYHAWRGISGQDFDQKSFVESMARGLTGSAMFGIGMALYEMGIIKLGTGDEEDKNIAGVRTARGDQFSPYIRIGDEYVSLTPFAPAASALIMGATAYDLFKEDTDKLSALYNASLAGLDQIFDASYMSSLQDIFQGYGSTAENIGTTVLNSAVSQNVPAILGQMATAMDPYVRDTKDKNVIMQALKAGLIQKIPGLRQMLPEKLDITGKPVESKEGLRNFFDPMTTTKVTDDPVLDELIDLARKSTDGTGFLPTQLAPKWDVTINKTDAKKMRIGRVRGGKYEAVNLTLTDDERLRVNQMYANLLFNGEDGRLRLKSRTGIRKLMGSARWQRMSDEQKMAAISEMKKEAKFLVLEALVRERKEAGETL